MAGGWDVLRDRSTSQRDLRYRCLEPGPRVWNYNHWVLYIHIMAPLSVSWMQIFLNFSISWLSIHFASLSYVTQLRGSWGMLDAQREPGQYGRTDSPVILSPRITPGKHCLETLETLGLLSWADKRIALLVSSTNWSTTIDFLAGTLICLGQIGGKKPDREEVKSHKVIS